MKNKKYLYFVLTLFFIFIFSEVCAYVVLIFFQKKGILYSPPKVLPAEYEEYLSKRDDVLGWPSPAQGGSRFTPAFPQPDKYPSCVSLYGDSFTYGSEVRHEDTWGSALSKLLNCRVANYGVDGYGTDQAYLRFCQNTIDNSGIVILGFSPENILRNINQYRLLLYCVPKSHERFALKPRFIIDGQGYLKIVPLLKLKYNEFLRLVHSPEKYLKYEFFLPGGKAGVFRKNFPYSLTLIKTMSKNFHIRAKIRDIPWYGEFYEIDHPSNALMVTFYIIKEFCLAAHKLNKIPIILVIPTGLDLVYYNEHKRWPYENLVRMLEKNKIKFIDAGPKIIGYLKNRNPRELFYNYHAHFNIEGNRILGEIVYAQIKDEKFFSKHQN